MTFSTERHTRRDAWASARGLRLSSSCRRCLCRLVRPRGRCRDCACPLSVRFPLFDHPDLWNRDGRPYALTSQPYSLQGLDDLHALAARAGLVVEQDDAASWHAPGRTHLLIIRRPEDAAARDEADAETERARLAEVRRMLPWVGYPDGSLVRRTPDGQRLATWEGGCAWVQLPEAHRADPVAVLRGLVPSDGRALRYRGVRTTPESGRAWADEHLARWGYAEARSLRRSLPTRRTA